MSSYVYNWMVFMDMVRLMGLKNYREEMTQEIHMWVGTNSVEVVVLFL